MIISTTATNQDWVWEEIDIDPDRVDYLQSAIDTPQLYTIYEQGLREGWIRTIS